MKIKSKKLRRMLRDKKLLEKLGDFGIIGQWSNGACVDYKVLECIKDKFNIKTMIDVGCGEGKQVEYARKIGINTIGVDGCPALSIYSKPYFVHHNYVRGMVNLGQFDLGWSVEFLEHVFDKYIPNFMDTLTRCKFVICTHAIPGQRGIHHVNCQTEEYWIKVFGEYGLEYDEKQTDNIKNLATMSHIRKRGLFFRNIRCNQDICND